MFTLKHKILLCEDEKNIVSFLSADLVRAGYEVDVAYDGETALTFFSTNEYRLILLDLMLPIINGLEVIQVIRKSSNVPVIILTARKDTFDKVLLLKSGADDYLTKPFDTMELLARIHRNIERTLVSQVTHIKQLQIEYESFTARMDAKDLLLTKTEFEILCYLSQNANKVLTREQIIRKLYGDFIGDSNVVDVNIKNIRKKIAQHTQTPYIETVRGKGYVMRT